MIWNVIEKDYDAKLDRLIPRNVPHRAALPHEIEHLVNLQGAPHVYFGCLCGHSHWTSKNLSLSPDGTYNGMRSIFYYGEDRECSCPAKNLRCIVPQ